MPPATTRPEEYTTYTIHPLRWTTITHAAGKEIPSIQIENDLRHPDASKKIPAGLTGKVAWTSYTYFIIRPMQFFHQQRIPGKLLSAERVHSTISSAVPGPYPEPLQTAARSREEEPQFGSRRREAPPYSGHTEVSREYHRRLHGAKLYPEAADREVLQFEASRY